MRTALWLAALACMGCAREAVSEPTTPNNLYARPAPPPAAVGTTWGDVAGWRGTAAQPVESRARRARHEAPAGYSVAASIPDGQECLADLARLGVTFQPLDAVKGVSTPVRVLGPIGGLRFRAVAGMQLVCDCRLVVALAWSAPHLRGLGIEELRFSGAYVDRRTRAGRPSLHARGLAIDIHAMATREATFSVEHDYERGFADGCRSDAPLLNQAACRLRGLGLYKELLTPDYDHDHHDHFHLGVAPLD